jgi:hypothetical protein
MQFRVKVESRTTGSLYTLDVVAKNPEAAAQIVRSEHKDATIITIKKTKTPQTA